MILKSEARLRQQPPRIGLDRSCPAFVIVERALEVKDMEHDRTLGCWHYCHDVELGPVPVHRRQRQTRRGSH